MSEIESNTDEGLIRTIGTKALGTNVFNMVVGAGIFVLPGVIAVNLGPAAIFAYLICAVAVGLIFLCYAEIGSRVTRSGGSYAYIEEAFGPFAGFISSLLLWFGWAVLSDAAITIAMVETITLAFPVLGEPLWRTLFIISLLGFLAFTNIIGVKSGVRLYMFNTFAKFIPLALLLVVGLFMIDLDNLVITEMPSLQNIGASTLILIFAFSGAECALNASGEVENPAKTVPRGLLLGLGSIFILYLGLQSVAQGVLGAELANNTEAPLAAAAKEIFGEWGVTMLLIGGAVSIFATLSGDILATPRVVFASARDGNLPKILAKVHPKYKTPYISVIFFSVVIGALALSGTFKQLAVMASGSILIVYAGVSLAALRLRIRDGAPKEGQFKMPGKLFVPLASCAVIAWMLWQLTQEEAIGLLILLGIAILLFILQRTIKKKSS